MKPPSFLDSVHTRALSSVLVVTLIVCASPAHGQPPLDLDSSPSFDFGSDPPADPLFTPELLGLTSGQPGFANADALRNFVEHVGTTFPPGLEVFIAYQCHPVVASGSSWNNEHIKTMRRN